MNPPGRERILLGLLLLAGFCVFVAGIGWGLPSHRVDPFLFGQHEVWSGEEIARLAGERADSNLGADVDRNPAARGSLLNETDQQRAEIIRRYRLFTYQPDEMITMMSLASMKHGDFDPKLYQYGGLWIYPIGAVLKAASIFRFITLVPLQSFYLDHPEEFGKFYIVARLYSAMWGLIGVWAVFRFTKSASAALLFILLPVVVNMSHEAKPHLAGAVLIILAAMAAGKFMENGSRRWWILAAVLCGMAAGMVISGIVAFLILPVMVWRKGIGIFFAAMGIAIGVYFLTNPYVLVHLVRDPRVLISNFGNSKTMYYAGFGVVNGIKLVAEGVTPVVMIVGLIGAIVMTAKPQAGGWRVLGIVAGMILVQFLIFAAGKGGEYGRFAILPDVVMGMAAVVLIERARIRGFEKAEAILLLLLFAGFSSAMYLHGFWRDSENETRRIADARGSERVKNIGAATLGVFDEPAPYLLPPVDLFSWKILLLERGFDLNSGDAPADVIVRPVDRLSQEFSRGAYVQIARREFDDLFPAQISWANKPIEIWVRKDLVRAAISE
jgi:hypothetical protein